MCSCSLAYTIVMRRLPKNDSITSVTMESLNPTLLASAIAYPKGYFAFTQKGCCGGQAPNFFSSYPTGVQVGSFLFWRLLPSAYLHRGSLCHC